MFLYLFLVHLHLLFAWALSTDRRGPSLPCPPCSCYIKNGRIDADCTQRNLSTVPQGLPRNTSSLNLAFNRIENMDSLKRYENLVILNISSNQLEMLPGDPPLNLLRLEILDFHSNRITSLSNESLSGLPNLKILDLRNNHLRMSTKVYPRGLFRSQTKLKALFLQNNSLGPEYPDSTFSDLPSLEELHIDGLINATFGKGFRDMQKLSNLSFDGKCNIRYITNKTFVNLQQLRFLDITYCNLLGIEVNAFQPLQKLKVLDLSHNVYLTVAEAGRSMYGLKNSSLKILKANKLQQPMKHGILVKAEDIKYMQSMQLEEIYLDGNRIEIFEPVVPQLLPNSLKVLSIQDNFLYGGMYLLTASAMMGLKYLYVSHQHGTNVQPVPIGFNSKGLLRSLDVYTMKKHFLSRKTASLSSSALSSFKNFNKRTISIPPNVTYFDASFSKLDFLLAKMNFNANVLKHVDISHNFFTRWEGPIGLSHLEYFDLSYNFCDNVSNSFFANLTSLKVLNISSNFLAYSLSEHTFKKLQKLEVLNLANNKIKYLKRNIFDNLRNIRVLDLSLNYMSKWDMNVKWMLNLVTLDLSYNLLQEVPNEIRLFIKEHPSVVRNLILKGNPLQCSCETLSSLKWTLLNRHHLVDFDNLYCETGTNSRQFFRNLDQVILELKKRCASYGVVLAAVLIAVVLCLGLIFAGLTYRYRWKLRYLYYLARMRHRGFVSVEDDGEFDFDAFISYADEDRALVVGEMRTKLEESRGLRLCIHHRDFLPGTFIADNILNAVKTSRKTVVMLSQNFLKSKWCQYEAEMAKIENIYTKRNILLVVVLEHIPAQKLPQDILDLMQKESYVEYTENEDGQTVFWENLYRGITST